MKHASPTPSLSESRWSGLYFNGQLSSGHVVAGLLQTVRDRHAVVPGVEDAIAVAILAGIPDPVGVPVCLGKVGGSRAVVAAVGHSVVILIHVVVVPRADVAGIAGAVAIGVRLVRVRNV